MVGYVTIGTKDMDRAIAFYDALLAEGTEPRCALTHQQYGMFRRDTLSRKSNEVCCSGADRNLGFIDLEIVVCLLALVPDNGLPDEYGSHQYKNTTMT